MKRLRGGKSIKSHVERKDKDKLFYRDRQIEGEREEREE